MARLECSYLLSLINPDNFNSQLETIFLANRLRLLKQIIINHRLMKIEIPLLEYILKILIDYQLISSSIVKLYFPFMDYYVKQSKDNSLYIIYLLS